MRKEIPMCSQTKEIWEMTKEEWLVDVGYKKSEGSRARKNWLESHESEVRIAIQNRKDVPLEVLEDYPELIQHWSPAVGVSLRRAQPLNKRGDEMTRLKAIKELREYDHAILHPTYALKIAKLFGLSTKDIPLRPMKEFRSSPNGVSYNCDDDALGCAAHELAKTIAAKMNLFAGPDYPQQIGVGSCLRVACDAVEEALKT